MARGTHGDSEGSDLGSGDGSEGEHYIQACSGLWFEVVG